MPTDSNGNYSLPPGYLAVTGQTVLASQHNPPLEDLGSSMTSRYVRDGRTPMLGNIPMNGYRAVGAADAVGNQDYVTLAQVNALIAAIQGVPTGVMVPFSGTTIPLAWLALNGQAVSRTTYSTLYAHALSSGNIAATEGSKTAGQFGPGDGTTTFSLPNLYADNGYFIRPISSGRTIGSVQADDLKSHAHTASFAGNLLDNHSHGGVLKTTGGGGPQLGGGSADAFTGDTNGATAGTPTGTVTVNATGGAETRPKNIAYPVIIKT